MKTPLYFISDIHLMLDQSTDEQHRRESLFRLMDQVKGTGGSLFFVGDLFDFYFEYPDLIPKAFADFYTKVLELKKSGVAFHFILGNHDYWVQDYMMKDIMDEVYFGDMEFSINGRNFFITHGDGLLSWDHGYRILKKIIRSRFFIWMLRWIHPTITYRLARWISRKGRHSNHPKKFRHDVREEIKLVAEKHIDNGFDYMICGHYHLGEMIDLNNGKLVIMGDWFRNPTYAYFNGKELTMHPWEHNA